MKRCIFVGATCRNCYAVIDSLVREPGDWSDDRSLVFKDGRKARHYARVMTRETGRGMEVEIRRYAVRI